MRVELLTPLGSETAEGDVKRDIGALVARAIPTGAVALEMGPADGAPLLRVVLSATEATRLSGLLQAIVNGRDEEIMITET